MLPKPTLLPFKKNDTVRSTYISLHKKLQPLLWFNLRQIIILPKRNSKTGTRPLLHCDYGHTKDRCFKFVSYLKWQNKPCAYNIESIAVPSTRQLTSTIAPQLTFEQHCNLCCSTFFLFNDTWILDSGGTDHIVYSRSFLSSIEPLSPTNLVKLPNGTFAHVLCISIVTLSKQITLHNVLCIPSFSYNLLSVQKLTSDLQCSIIFFSDHYIFQDQLSRTTIGAGREHNGFFHSSKAVFASLVHSTTPMDLWHWRLGHLSHAHLHSLIKKHSHISPLIIVIIMYTLGKNNHNFFFLVV
ncbi:hypothetical protein AMTRI_Chr01g108120 [Amborella trichopoda]